MSTFGEWLLGQRNSRKWTQPELARKLDASARTVQSWETEGKVPHRATLNRIASLFGVDEEHVIAISRGQPIPTIPQGALSQNYGFGVSEETAALLTKIAQTIGISPNDLIERMLRMIMDPISWLATPLSQETPHVKIRQAGRAVIGEVFAGSSASLSESQIEQIMQVKSDVSRRESRRRLEDRP